MNTITKQEEPPKVWPLYAPPANPTGIPIADVKFHKPLMSLAKSMVKKAPKAKGKSKHSDRIHVSKRKWPGYA